MNNSNAAREIPLPVEPSTSDMVVRLGHAFLRFAQRDGDISADKLAQSINRIQQNVIKLQDLTPTPEQTVLLAATMSALNEIIVSFQFFDRISQRMEHALKCMQTLESVDVGSALDSEFNLLAIRSILTMEDERHVFDQVISGVGVGKAITNAIEASQQSKSSGNDIELF